MISICSDHPTVHASSSKFRATPLPAVLRGKYMTCVLIAHKFAFITAAIAGCRRAEAY
jgi:hypothetical protein